MAGKAARNALVQPALKSHLFADVTLTIAISSDGSSVRLKTAAQYLLAMILHWNDVGLHGQKSTIWFMQMRNPTGVLSPLPVVS